MSERNNPVSEEAVQSRCANSFEEIWFFGGRDVAEVLGTEFPDGTESRLCEATEVTCNT